MTTPVTIFHNPACSTSRNALSALRERGYAPTVVEYLKAGWTRPQLEALFAKMGVTACEALRERGTPAEELGLLKPGVSEGAILDAMVAHPILVNRPIVETPKGAVLTRPMEKLDDLLKL
jgi:arsenate reductase